jgi:hypothetical protein
MEFTLFETAKQGYVDSTIVSNKPPIIPSQAKEAPHLSYVFWYRPSLYCTYFSWISSDTCRADNVA